MSATGRLPPRSSASPVVIDVGGTTMDSSGGDNILVRQGCTAGISGIPDALLNNTTNPPTYQWSVSGSTFQTWSPTTPAIPPAPANPNASYFLGGSGPLVNATAKWYWNDLSPTTPETVTCTVTATPPTGQGAPFPVTVTQTINVSRPTYQAAGQGGYMQVNKADANDTIHYNLWAGAVAGQPAPSPAGMNFQATVTTPSPFGPGKLEIVQLVTPSNKYTTLADPTQTHSDPNNGILGLDLNYPYGNHVAMEVPAPAIAYQDNDAPRIQLDGTVVLNSAMKGGSYNDYLMYCPPGGDSQFVPLAEFNWTANGKATIPSTKNWGDYVKENGSDAAGEISPSGSTLFSDIMGPLTFPQWTHIDASGSF